MTAWRCCGVKSPPIPCCNVPNARKATSMDKTETLNRLRKLGLVSVLRGPSEELTLKMVDALVEGGVLGMGAVTVPEQAAAAKESGARYIVSPHCEERLGEAMVATGLAVMIGALSPSEVVRARQFGADVVKLFPGSLGGPDYLKALRGPYPDIPFMPTGGVEANNIADWFAAGAIAVGAGSNLCPTAWAKEGRFADITGRAKEFEAAVGKARSPRP